MNFSSFKLTTPISKTVLTQYRKAQTDVIVWFIILLLLPSPFLSFFLETDFSTEPDLCRANSPPLFIKNMCDKSQNAILLPFAEKDVEIEHTFNKEKDAE